MFKFSWYIENFSFLNNSTGEYVNSPHFKIKSLDNKDAFIRLFPRGKLTNTVVTCYLCTTEDSNVFSSDIMDLKVKLAFNCKMFSKELLLDIKKEEKKELFLVFRREDLDSVRSHPSYDDNITIECLIQNESCSVLSRTAARTAVQFEEHSYDLPINTSLITRPSSWARALNFSKYISYKQSTEELKIYIDFEENTSDYVIEISKVSAHVKPVVMFCKVLLCSSEKFTCLTSGEQYFKTKNDIWKACFDIRENDVTCSSFLRCELKLSYGSVISNLIANDFSETLATKSSTISGKCDNKILDIMYEEKKFCDITLQVGSEQFPAHKSVLGTVSDVFAAMFETDMKEKQSSVIIIDDIDSDIINKMLLFLYTGTTGDLALEELLKLYSTSDKYQILNLKTMCSSELMKKIKVDNVCEILEIANLHQDKLLEDFVRAFIYTNHKEICGTEDWKSLMERKHKLAADVMLQICKRS